MAFKNSPVEYAGHWPDLFEFEAAKIRNSCDTVAVHHIGSTSIAGMTAKPIIDVLVEVGTGKLPKLQEPLGKLGYIFKCENGISGRAYFSKETVHIHCFEEKHSEVTKHLAFRDYLRAHRNVAKQYMDLKATILQNPQVTRDEYQGLKSEFLVKVINEALAWKSTRPDPERIVQKVVIYCFKRIQSSLHVLVFDHAGFPHVSPQVPSGTVENGESISSAAHRELYEEAGLTSKLNLKFLGSYVYYRRFNDQFQNRHFFTVNDNSIGDHWTHEVTGKGDDKSLMFKYYWMPVTKAQTALKADLGDGLTFFTEEICGAANSR